jgi:hypothetical protein
MKMTLTALQTKPQAKPYVDHVAACMAEVLPAVVAWRESDEETPRFTLESRLAELQHACEMARRAL